MLLTVSDISRILNINPETVRRWIRDNKLHVSHSVGRTAQVSLQEVIRFVNEPPGYYLDAMEAWLHANGIPYKTITKDDALPPSHLPLAFGLAGAALGGSLLIPGLMGSAIAGTAAAGTTHALVNSISNGSTQKCTRQLLLTEQTDPLPLTLPTECADVSDPSSFSEKTGQDDNITVCKHHIRAAKMQLTQLLQKRAQLNAEITIVQKQLEYYQLILEELLDD